MKDVSLFYAQDTLDNKLFRCIICRFYTFSYFCKKITPVKTRDDVQRFLDQFFPKLEIWGIFFLEREKNLDALKELGITFHKAEKKLQYAFRQDGTDH